MLLGVLRSSNLIMTSVIKLQFFVKLNQFFLNKKQKIIGDKYEITQSNTRHPCLKIKENNSLCSKLKRGLDFHIRLCILVECSKCV